MGQQQQEFDDAWRRIESALKRKLLDLETGRPDSRHLSIEETIRVLETHGLLSHAVAITLNDLRLVRNFNAHVGSTPSGEPLVVPTESCLERARWCIQVLYEPPLASAILQRGTVCVPDTPVKKALSLMKSGDYDMLPYHDGLSWRVFSRQHVALWLEMEASTNDGGVVHLPMDLTVAEVVSLTGTLQSPIVIPKTLRLHEAVERLSAATQGEDPDAPMLLARDKTRVLVATAADLPKALSILLAPV